MKNQLALTRRHFVGGTAVLAGAAALPSLLRAQNAAPPADAYHFNEATQPAGTKAPLAPAEPGKDYKPTITLNGSTLQSGIGSMSTTPDSSRWTSPAGL